MSKIKLSALFVTIGLLTGCTWSGFTSLSSDSNSTTADAQTYWLDYALTQCNEAPWGKTTEPQVVTDFYSATITVFAVEVTPPTAGMVFCSACGCPTGTVVSIQTDSAGQTYLLEQGFTTTGEALDSATFIETEPTVVVDTVSPAASTTTTTADSVVAVNSNTVVEVSTATTTATEPVEDDVTTPIAVEVPAATSEAVPVEEVAIAEIDTDADVVLSEADANLQERAKQVEAALADYYSQYGSYPDELTVLQLSVDLTSITYTPIGALPASYYDLAIAYTTGAEILNP